MQSAVLQCRNTLIVALTPWGQHWLQTLALNIKSLTWPRQEHNLGPTVVTSLPPWLTSVGSPAQQKPCCRWEGAQPPPFHLPRSSFVHELSPQLPVIIHSGDKTVDRMANVSTLVGCTCGWPLSERLAQKDGRCRDFRSLLFPVTM